MGVISLLLPSSIFGMIAGFMNVRAPASDVLCLMLDLELEFLRSAVTEIHENHFLREITPPKKIIDFS